MPKQGGSDTIHPGVIDFNGGSYFFYHKAALQGGDSFHRAVCVEKFTYNADGTFPTINMTTTGGIGGTPTQRQNTPTIRPGTPTPTRRGAQTPTPTRSGGSGTKVECENMTLGGSYTTKITSPFSGVALYANNDYCSYTQYFANSTHSFSVRGCSNNSSAARVDLRIGGATVGSLYFTGTTPTVQTLTNISHTTGNQEIRLTVTTDTGSWDAYVDYLQIN